MIYGLLALAVLALWLVGRSRIGRAMEAMREDETAAAVMGVPVRRYKMGVLLASAALAGLAGCLSAHVSSFIGPNEYGFEPAVTILSFALLGGIGTPLAPVLGAWVLTLLPELLRGVQRFPAGAERADHRGRGAVPAERAASPCGCAGGRRDALLTLERADAAVCGAGGGRWGDARDRAGRACMR